MKLSQVVDIEDIRRTYATRFPNGHWFDQGTLRFFKCRLPTYGFQADDGRVFFVTSEQGPNGKRRFSVRCLTSSGVNTVGAFQEFASRVNAVAAMRRSVQGAQ